MDTTAVDAAKAAKAGKLEKTDIVSDDHPWHRSLWFSYQSVNGTSSGKSDNTGSTKHDEFVSHSGGPQAKIVARNDWLNKDGKKLLEDRAPSPAAPTATTASSISISRSRPPKATSFSAMKKTAFLACESRYDAGQHKQGGDFVSSEGKVNEDENPTDFPTATSDPSCKRTVWGNKASWVDYHGPVEGETLGIAILEHPSSYGFPTRWHSRNYGLHAANVFAQHVFDETLPQASTTLKSGDTMTFRFRVILHKGDEKEGHIAEAWEKYSHLP